MLIDCLSALCSQVVDEVTSREKRDKMVRRAAKRFLMAAHHDKLYPPSEVYQINFGIDKKGKEKSFSSDPCHYYELEVSKPEYFGWLLFSVGMLIHHMPRSYLHSLDTLQRAVGLSRANAKKRWSEIRRKSRLSIILSRLNLNTRYEFDTKPSLRKYKYTIPTIFRKERH